MKEFKKREWINIYSVELRETEREWMGVLSCSVVLLGSH